MPQQLTARGVAELAHHEGIVLEWYRDSRGIGTWGLGVTSASGHGVERYRDKPQTVERCLEVALWLLNTRYVPDVLKAFRGRELSEMQLAAATSFHYNTGGILRASWVGLFLGGQTAKAQGSFLSWNQPPEIVGRREDEALLFFTGKWAGDGTVPVFPVLKPSYRPDLRHPRIIRIGDHL